MIEKDKKRHEIMDLIPSTSGLVFSAHLLFSAALIHGTHPHHQASEILRPALSFNLS
jgi:hypothetical protein